MRRVGSPAGKRRRGGAPRPPAGRAASGVEVPFRIVLESPPSGVAFALQRGRDELVAQQRSTGASLSFDFTIRVDTGPDGKGSLRLLGPFTQGPPASRFVYVNSGTMAGDSASPWTRRAKVPLAGIDRATIAAAVSSPGSRIEARVVGTARDGGPACATCRPTGGGWSVVTTAVR